MLVAMELTTLGLTTQAIQNSYCETIENLFSEYDVDYIISKVTDAQTQKVLRSYGIISNFEHLRWLKAAGFPKEGWENSLLSKDKPEDITSTVIDFLTCKDDYSYIITDEFIQQCKEYDESVDETYYRFYAFLISAYGGGCSHYDFKVKHHTYSIALSSFSKIDVMLQHFGVTNNLWVIDTLLSIGKEPESFTEAEEKLYKVIRRID